MEDKWKWFWIENVCRKVFGKRNRADILPCLQFIVIYEGSLRSSMINIRPTAGLGFHLDWEGLSRSSPSRPSADLESQTLNCISSQDFYGRRGFHKTFKRRYILCLVWDLNNGYYGSCDNIALSNSFKELILIIRLNNISNNTNLHSKPDQTYYIYSKNIITNIFPLTVNKSNK